MKVYFWRSANDRILQCRRGRNSYRPLEIPANVDVAEYSPLTNSTLELIDQGMVIGVAEVGSAVATKLMLQSTDNLERLVESAPDLEPEPDPEPDLENQSTEEPADVESSSEESVDDQVSDESPSEGEDPVQRVGDESIDNAGAFSGTAEVQVSPVAEGDDGLDSGSERGPEVGSDGLYSNDDGMDVAQDRSGEEIDAVSSSDESSGSD